MFLARTQTILPTKNILLIVREDVFPHKLQLQRHNGFLGGDHRNQTRSANNCLAPLFFW